MSLQKFKLLATQCAVIGSPARSPTTSPVIHIRRRKTLRMFLGGKGNGSVFNRRFIYPSRRVESLDRQKIGTEKSVIEKENIGARLKLKDLFVSSSTPTKVLEEDGQDNRLLLTDSSSAVGGEDGGVVVRRVNGGGVRPFSATLRQRLLMRRMWRPVLVGIPEHSP
ncbi:unnamed protein product [Amaranthus hypochondriacus]